MMVNVLIIIRSINSAILEKPHLSTTGGDIENTMNITLENTVTHEQHPHITDNYDNDNINMNINTRNNT